MAPNITELKRRARDDAIEKVSELLYSSSQHEATLNEYTRTDASGIVANIAARKWTAKEVMVAYIRRAIVAHNGTNAITEVMFEEAIAQAEKLDEEFAATGKLRGPLHGVPFTVKDVFNVEGKDTTVGYSSWANQPKLVDSDFVRLIRKAGGIPFVKSNIPQTLVSFECSNPLWGRTLNPHLATPALLPDHKFNVPLTEDQRKRPYTAGGSSGGEVALLASDAAAIGIGTDVGGSLRVPTGFCGVFGFKATPGRTSGAGAIEPAPGFEATTHCHGPLGRSVEDLRLACEVLLGQLGAKAPVPFRKEIAEGLKGRMYRIGYYLSDGVVKASPANQRAVIEAVEALTAAGHECVLFEPPNAARAGQMFIAFQAADGFQTLLGHARVGGDPIEPTWMGAKTAAALPRWLKSILAFAMEKFGDPVMAGFVRVSHSSTSKEYLDLIFERNKMVDTWNDQVWKQGGFDAIVCPTYATPGLEHGSSGMLAALCAAAALYNIIPSAAGVLPVTRVDPSKDAITPEWLEGSPDLANKLHLSSATASPPPRYPNGPHGSKMTESDLYAGGFANTKQYDPEAMAGLPVGVQVVGRPFDDEKVLEVMRVVDELLGERGFGPGMSERNYP